MSNPFSEIRAIQSQIAAEWAAKTFATGATYRMFREKQKADIEKFLKKKIGNGQRLASLSTHAYDKELERLIWQFQLRFKCNDKMSHVRPHFGQAAKVVNLYIRQLLLFPQYLLPYDKKKIEMNAHVILDGKILRQVNDNLKLELKEQGIIKSPQLSTLYKKEYFAIQNVIRVAAKRAKIPPIAYDFLWAL
jgi:hypothetical protein